MGDDLVFTISAAAVSTLTNAGSASLGPHFIVGSGDLHQMGVQAKFLADHGFLVGHSDVYPTVKTSEEQNRALRMLYDESVDGWWNLEHHLIQNGICNQAEFDAKLGRKPREG